ncbi:transcriptional regulator, XRE family with cupin sensor [Rhizobiales bacterium GAS113]|nr:transcriptional regulator, XRE family with cupin sensor [Rhizobiales bacterium GAS113]
MSSNSAAVHEAGFTSGGSLGLVIRRLRTQRNLSLQRLAELSDVSVGMLSHIERDLTSPSLRTLTKIRLALKVPISALFENAGEPDGVDFVRRADGRPILDLGPQLLVKQLLSPANARSLQFMMLIIPPGGGSGTAPIGYPSEKGGLVIEGRITLHVGANSVILSEGDSFQFDGATPHHFVNEGAETAKVLWMIVQLGLERHL